MRPGKIPFARCSFHFSICKEFESEIRNCRGDVVVSVEYLPNQEGTIQCKHICTKCKAGSLRLSPSGIGKSPDSSGSSSWLKLERD